MLKAEPNGGDEVGEQRGYADRENDEEHLDEGQGMVIRKFRQCTPSVRSAFHQITKCRPTS